MRICVASRITLLSRSREGARIEMPRNANVGQYISVAPARERGLKSNLEVRAEPFRA